MTATSDFYRHPITQGSYDRQMHLWGSVVGGGYELTAWIAERPQDVRTFDNTRVWDAR